MELTKHQNLLVQILQHVFRKAEWLDSKNFFEEIPVFEALQCLKDQPDIRVRILCDTSVVSNPRLATRKTPESATGDIEICIDEGLTTYDAVLDALTFEDAVRYLPEYKLSNLIKTVINAQAEAGEDIQGKLTFDILEKAKKLGLLTDEQILDRVGIMSIAEHIELDELRILLARAYTQGKENEAFTSNVLFDIVPLQALATRAHKELRKNVVQFLLNEDDADETESGLPKS